jgi:hypothetical protein
MSRGCWVENPNGQDVYSFGPHGNPGDQIQLVYLGGLIGWRISPTNLSTSPRMELEGRKGYRRGYEAAITELLGSLTGSYYQEVIGPGGFIEEGQMTLKNFLQAGWASACNYDYSSESASFRGETEECVVEANHYSGGWDDGVINIVITHKEAIKKAAG